MKSYIHRIFFHSHEIQLAIMMFASRWIIVLPLGKAIATFQRFEQLIKGIRLFAIEKAMNILERNSESTEFATIFRSKIDLNLEISIPSKHASKPLKFSSRT